MSFTQVITSVGLAKIAAALAGGDPVDITEVAVGDADTTPAVDLTELGNEVWRGDVNLVAAVEGDPDQVRVEAIVPVEDGGWTMREAGAFDAEGDLILVARIPDSYKPDPAVDGAGVTAYLRLVVEIANAADALSLTVDDSTVMATKQYVDEAIVPLTDHLDGGASKHDASELDDETAGGYHGATVQLTLDALSSGLASHEDGGASKHDATEVDYEGSDPAKNVEFSEKDSVEAVLQLIARAFPVACGIFKLADGVDDLVQGAGWSTTPITRIGNGKYTLQLRDPIRRLSDQALDIEGMTIFAMVGAHGAGYVGSYVFEVDPSLGGRTADSFTLQCCLPEAHDAGDNDAGPIAWAANPPADDTAGVRLMVLVYSATNFLSALPTLYVNAP